MSNTLLSTSSLVRRASAFEELGFAGAVKALLDEIVATYLANDLPFLCGYSGGKDSTAVLQLVWMAMRTLKPEQRTKPIHVISTNTLVENPIVVQWADGSFAAMRAAAERDGLPIELHRLQPALEDSFWVNLIGKGYPAPRHGFRWCTERLKIRPSNSLIERLTKEGNGSMLLLGTRKTESVTRGRRMKKLEEGRVMAKVSPNAALAGSFVYSPIEDWTNDDVWMFLMQSPNPWGWSNKSLMGMYRSASEDNECPVVLDTSTPSCGNSRFGCWTCTMVEQDKSLTAMTANDDAFEWMLPLVALRNELDVDNDRHLRDFRRLSGKVEYMRDGDAVIPGPYTKSAREAWLTKLLETQRVAREMAPANMRSIELIQLEELRRIRRIWELDKFELEDTLPSLYLAATGQPFDDVALPLPTIDLGRLQSACGTNHLYEMCRSIIGVMHFHRDAGDLPTRTKSVFERYLFESEAQAIAAAPREQLNLLAGIEHPPIDLQKLHSKRVKDATDALRAMGWLEGKEELVGTEWVEGMGKKRGRKKRR